MRTKLKAAFFALLVSGCGHDPGQSPSRKFAAGSESGGLSGSSEDESKKVAGVSAQSNGSASTQASKSTPSSSDSGSGTGAGGTPVSTPDLAMAAREFTIPARSFDSPSRDLWATFYHTLRFQSSQEGMPLLSLNGTPLGPKLSKLQWCQAAMEGSVQVFFEGVWRTYNYAGSAGTVQVDCTEYYDHPVGRTRFTLARGPFGDGVRSYILVPFRTIAVDPAVIPYGSVIYIDAARGLPFVLSDGSERRHDGYFFAGDTGGLINGNHIDVFIGNALRSPFPWITSQSKSRIGYRIVPDADIQEVLLKMHLLERN